MENYIALIEDGWCPVWSEAIADSDSGDADPEYGRVLVKLAMCSRRVWCSVPFRRSVDTNCDVLLKASAVAPGSEIGILGTTTGVQALTRIAAIQGIGPFMRPGWGIGGSIPAPPCLRVAGLDLEQSTFYRSGKFPLPHDPLLSAAISTWDGRHFCRYTCGHHDASKFKDSRGVDVARVPNSEKLVEWIINWILEESPDFVVIHNGYNFDIGRMAVHSPPSMSHYFRRMNLGKGGSGTDLIIPGTTVIDTYSYLDKLHRSDYESMSLDSLSMHFGATGKSTQPSLSIDVDSDPDMTDVAKYNMHDSYLHCYVAHKSGCVSEITSMCSVFKCPILDVCRFISGTMSSTMFSSFAVELGSVVDWSADPNVHRRIEGALVISPIKGHHRNVSVCDFSGLYPNIMISADISVETVCPQERLKPGSTVQTARELGMDPDMRHGAVSWMMGHVYTCIDGELVRLGAGPGRKGVASKMLTHLVAERARVGKKTTSGWALKIGANSFYGAFGARTSGLFNYFGASSVTAIGRWLLTSLTAIATGLGFKVVYGDTDSVFNRRLSSKSPPTEVYLKIVHKVLSFTPFAAISLEYEKELSDLILVERKLYYAMTSRSRDSTPLVKGLAPARKDRPPLVSELVSSICKLICYLGPERARPMISKLITAQFTRVSVGAASLEEMSLERRKGGVSYLSYTDSNNVVVNVRKDKAAGHKGEVSVQWITRLMRQNANGVLEACSLPGCDKLMSEYITLYSKMERR